MLAMEEKQIALVDAGRRAQVEVVIRMGITIVGVLIN